jgi:acetoin utilization deacetylase AcuC-like enzyme
MEKYRLLRERVAGLPDISLSVPEPATISALRRVHTSEYVERVSTGTLDAAEVRRIGFPWSPELVERSKRSVGGTMAAACAAMEDGVSVNLAGGTHHAFPDRGEGYCVFNDVAIAVCDIRARHPSMRCAVIDLDVHQGNGTAAIFAAEPDVFTLSVHGANNFPFRKESSDLDIALADGAADGVFLEAVSSGLDHALAFEPDLVFYVAGADPCASDRLGRLSVSKAGLAERDSMVFSRCAEAGTPVAVVMSGGYAENVTDTVDIHMATVEAALDHSLTRALT